MLERIRPDYNGAQSMMQEHRTKSASSVLFQHDAYIHPDPTLRARDEPDPCRPEKGDPTVKPWSIISPDDIDVVAPDGSVRSSVKGYFSGKQFVIDDMSVDVREGDEIRRTLPNGREEAFVVTDPTCYTAGHFGPHYQVAVTRRGIFDKHVGGNYTINVSGNNSRVNVGSTDNSSNTVEAPGSMLPPWRQN